MPSSDDKPTKLLWLDLEMTGLDPSRDKIIEVAAVVTDWDFSELGTYETTVQQEAATIEGLMDASDFWQARPEEAAKIQRELVAGKSSDLVQNELTSLIEEHFGAAPATLAGNSIHQDRRFIRASWPKLDAMLHYRMLDVSAWKIVMEGKYGLAFEKTKAHRALDDIRESIAELKFYLMRLQDDRKTDS